LVEWLENWISDGAIAALAGLATGLMLGLAARLARFCTLGAIEDALYGDDYRRIRMWPLALAVAIAVNFLAAAAGLLDLERTLYLSTAWSPLASVVGGLVFGYGMALAGNCGFGALARLGGGDIRSFLIVLVIGVSSYITLNGPLAYIRVALFEPAPFAEGDAIPGIAHGLGAAAGLPLLATALGVAALLAAISLSSPAFRAERKMVVWSVVAGLAISFGFIATTLIAEAAFDPVAVASHSFTRPLGDTLFYLMTSSGGGINFAVGSVAGVLAGAIAGSVWQRSFRWEACDDPVELGRQAFGGFLMGVGGVVALGCSVGQGLSAFSTLSYSAPVVAAAIFAGAALGLRRLIHGFAPN
jgi:uncharacterized membrane protein YedE/YeeE